MTSLSPDAIRSEVSRFWNAFSDKDVERLQEFYAHESVGFGSGSTRTEPGRLAATRRHREYFANSAPIKVTVGGIDIVMLHESAAVATYTFQFQAVRSTATGKVDENIRNGRASHVFAFDPDGKLRIFHEHLSVAS